MLRVLWHHFAGQSWACVPQVTVNLLDLDTSLAGLSSYARHRVGFQAALDDPANETATEVYNASADRRIDLLALRRPPKRTDIGPLETLAIEVKVTRADFLSDVKNPHKQAAWRAAATRHAYAVPAGLVKPDEVPDGCGLIYVKAHGSTDWGFAEWVARAPYTPGHAPQLPTRVRLALMHRAASLEGATRGWSTGPAAAGAPQELRAALAAAHKATEKADRAAAKAEDQVSSWRAAYALAAADGHPCADCGRPVKPLRPRGGWFTSWRHIDKGDDEPCVLIQTANAEHDARERYDAADQQTRDREVRYSHTRHRDRFDPAVEAEPWRAFILTGFIGTVGPGGSAPTREDDQ